MDMVGRQNTAETTERADCWWAGGAGRGLGEERALPSFFDLFLVKTHTEV